MSKPFLNLLSLVIILALVGIGRSVVATTLRIEPLRLQQRFSSGTETSYLFDGAAASSSGLNEAGEPVGEVSILPGPELAASEVGDFYRRLFERSLRVAPEVSVAEHDRLLKYYERYTAGARRYSPEIALALEGTHRNDYDPELSQSPGDGSEYRDGADVAEWAFELELPLYNRPKAVALEAAGRSLELAQKDLELQLSGFDSRLRELLGAYMVAAYRLLNLENSVLLSAEHVNRIRRGFELRDQTRLELMRAQANLKELEARVDLERQRKNTAIRELLDFTGLNRQEPLFQTLERLLESERQAAMTISSFADADRVLEAMDPYLNRMSIARLREIYQENSTLADKFELQRELDESRAERYLEREFPDLSLKADYGREENTRFEDFEPEGTVGLYLNIPIFSGGTVYSGLKSRTQARQLAAEQYRSVYESTFNRLLNRREALVNLSKVFRKQQVNLLQLQEIVQLSIKSYVIKQTSMQDLLTSKNQLIDAKNQLIGTVVEISNQAHLLAWELGMPLSKSWPEEE